MFYCFGTSNAKIENVHQHRRNHYRTETENPETKTDQIKTTAKIGATKIEIESSGSNKRTEDQVKVPERLEKLESTYPHCATKKTRFTSMKNINIAKRV